MPITTWDSLRVPPVGPKDCDIAFVGEAPGEQEELVAEPFIGTSGTLLNKKLHKTGILRHMSYIDNVIPFRPITFFKHHEVLGFSGIKPPKAENDFSIFWRGKNPTQALIQYRDELLQRLMNVNCKVVVALGGSPLWALTGKTGISKWRGSILPCTLPNGKVLKCIPTYHPAAVTREHKLGAIVECDLLKAKEQSKFSEIILPERELRIAPTYNDVVNYIMSPDWKYCSFDIETSPSNITCISLAPTPYLSMSIPTTKYYWGSISRLHDVLRMVEHRLKGDIPKVGQNISYDLQYLFRIFAIYPSKPWHDTMIMQHSCYPDLSAEQKDETSTKKKIALKTKSLAFLTSIYTNEPYYKDDLKVWMSGGTSDEGLWTYNAKDSAVTLECAFELFKEMEELSVRHTYDFMMELLEPLLFMMLYGIKVDTEVQARHITEMKKKLHDNEAILKEKYGDINPRSPKQILELIHKLGLKCPTKKGKPTTDKKALNKLAAKSPEFKSIVYAREANTLLSNHLAAPVDPITGRWYCSFNSTGTSTGRLSSSTGIFGSATNLQNVKVGLRDMCIPDEGMVFTEADLKGAEAMVVAFLCEDEILMDMMLNGGNVHTYTATEIIWPGLTKADIEKDKKECKARGVETESKYYQAKKTRHSGNYLIGGYTLGLDLKISTAEAEILLQNFYDRSPRLTEWHSEVEMTMKRNNNTLITPIGRKRKFFGRPGPELLKEAVAFLPQSTVSDILNTGLIRVYKELCAVYKSINIILQVHDSILIQHPPALTMFVYDMLKKLMDVPLTIKGRTFSIPIELKTGRNWKDMK